MLRSNYRPEFAYMYTHIYVPTCVDLGSTSKRSIDYSMLCLLLLDLLL